MRDRIVLLLALLGCALLSACARREPTPTVRADTAVLGAGTALPNCGIAALPDQALARLNAERAAGHRCGARLMPPSQPLKWDPALQSAAAMHSIDMAKRNYFEHRDPDGERVGQRAARSNYSWRAIGENLAGGDINVEEVMDGWLGSPEHCANMLDAAYADVALACVQQPGSKWGTYWTMVLGRRR
jgi:uncharacterized protein YkwD